MVRKYMQLMPYQRNEIQRGLNQGLSIRGIARQLGRSPSTISREIRRGAVWERLMMQCVVGKHRRSDDARASGS